MTPQRWQTIKDVFTRALALHSSERFAFLDEACAGDDELRAEVMSLLESHDKDADFLNAPASISLTGEAAISSDTDEENKPSLINRCIEHYRVLSLIARGGMGEVYLAEDESLGRRVVLKVLPSRFTEDVDRVRRFQQEARAVSALNHPNIVTIYGIAHVDDMRFIVTEYVDGETLRERMKREPLGMGDMLEIALQVAAALSSAHEAGIIHRDIKPENIMVRPDGYVKLLDFGIAKLSRVSHDKKETDSASSTINLVHTAPHQVIGTVSYMSPEQARGRVIDRRTDIWSLGVVMYEMISGRVPFTGESPYEVIASVLEHHPPPLASLAPATPFELQRIVKKSLMKNRDERYQTIKDFYLDLRNLKHEYEIAQTGESINGFYASDALDSPLASETDRHARANMRVHDSGGSVARRQSPEGESRLLLANSDFTNRHSAEHQVQHPATQGIAQPRGLSFKQIALLLALIIVLAGGSFFSIQLFRTAPSQTAFVPATLRKLTNNGRIAGIAAISPDGKSIAYVQQESGGKQSLIVSSIASNAVPKIAAEDVEYTGIAFTPDGEYIYYTRTESSPEGRLYQVPAFGGAPKKVLDGVSSPVAFSPDGEQFAFVRFDESTGIHQLMTATKDGANARALTSRQGEERLSLNSPAWSPDGARIVCAAARWDNGYKMYLFEIAPAGGQEKRIESSTWFSINDIVWRDATHLVISATTSSTGYNQLYEIAYPGGSVQPLTTDLSSYLTVSVSRDGKSLLSVQSTPNWNIWVMPRIDSDRVRRITSGVGFSQGLAWTTDNRIISSSMMGGNLNLVSYLTDSSGNDSSGNDSSSRQLTFNVGDNYHPAVSPDNRFIVFTSNRNGGFNLWRMDAADGGNPKQLTDGGADFFASFAPDGKTVFYEHQSRSIKTLRSVSIDGGEAKQLTDKFASIPTVSPDGKQIACRYILGDKRTIALLTIDDGALIKTLPIPVIDWQRIRWTTDRRNLIYVDTRDGNYNLWSYPLDGGTARQLTHFAGERIFSYDLNPRDGSLAVERGNIISDVVLFKTVEQTQATLRD